MNNDIDEHLATAITAGAIQLQLSLSGQAVTQLVQFIQQLSRWNKVYNLTAVRRPQDMVAHHILDSLSLLPWLQGRQILDIGSGAGLPGIPLAIVRSEQQFHLLDSNAKRTRFMIQMVAELGLHNVSIVRSRIEDYQPAFQFDCITARAYASLADLLAASTRLCAANGCILAMKGQYPDTELEAIEKDNWLIKTHPVQIPGLDAKRHIIHLSSITQLSESQARNR